MVITAYSPYERKPRVSGAIVLEGVDDLCLGLPKLSLDGEHSGEDEYATHQADNIVHDGSGTAKFDGSLRPLHKSGISQKGSKSSSCYDHHLWMYRHIVSDIRYACILVPVSQAFWEMASNHNLEDFILSAGRHRDDQVII